MDNMDSEPSDLEVMRLVAYVTPDLSDDDEEGFQLSYEDFKNTQIDEYLIDYISKQEALGLGNDGILQKVANTLYGQNIISVHNTEPKSISWRLFTEGGKTFKEKQELEEYQVTDLRSLH
jgi:hypothetical protein